MFPVTKETAQIEKEASKILPRGTERILFVDDEASLVKMVTQMLQQQGYEVMGKTSSTEVLKLFQEESDKFDLVITDMTMPHMTGDKLAAELIKIRGDIPVILCTGYSNKMSKRWLPKSGSKPLPTSRLTRRSWPKRSGKCWMRPGTALSQLPTPTSHCNPVRPPPPGRSR